MSSTATSTSVHDPVNAAILRISEDRITGFHRDPFALIAQGADLPESTVHHRLRAMVEAGVIRRIRQTLLATNLARGALVAWRLPGDKLDAAFDWLDHNDPFTGHTVIRSTDPGAAGAAFRLWTTLKVPPGYSMQRHCDHLAGRVGAEQYITMPARCLFKLGVGHVRRRSVGAGTKAPVPAKAVEPRIVKLDETQWRVLMALKQDFDSDEIRSNPWGGRAKQAGLSVDQFCQIGHELNDAGVIGRFSTFLEHARPVAGHQPVVRYNGLFHWAVLPGEELRAGSEVGRFEILTHAYWREAGPRFGNVNLMAVAHGYDKARLLQHKQAIDDHLASIGIDVTYTAVFWGGRSAIKPSEIAPQRYRAWCIDQGLDPEAMRRTPGPIPTQGNCY